MGSLMFRDFYNQKNRKYVMKIGITLAIPFVLAGCLVAAVIQVNTEPDVSTYENKRINV